MVDIIGRKSDKLVIHMRTDCTIAYKSTRRVVITEFFTTVKVCPKLSVH